MAVPKKRHTLQKTRQRRANWKLKEVETTKCPECGAVIRSHFACPECGKYNGRDVVKVEKPIVEQA